MLRILLTLLLLTSCSNHSIAIYDIVQPSKKFHPIIKIVNLATGGSCSAFVISDEIAMTASHCMKVTEEFIVNIPLVLKASDEKLKALYNQLEQFHQVCTFPSTLCDKDIMEINMEINKETANRKTLLDLKPDLFSVTEVSGVLIPITAIAFQQNYQRDYAFIRGNFKAFNKLPIAKGFDVKAGDILKACGFPGAKVPAICMDFEAVGQIGFMYAGHSLFLPGISGGPVINANGEVVGVCSRVLETVSIFEPTLGTVNVK